MARVLPMAASKRKTRVDEETSTSSYDEGFGEEQMTAVFPRMSSKTSKISTWLEDYVIVAFSRMT